MEEHSKVTRFCIICNYYYKIINPIVSRCSIFRFKPIPEKIIINKLQEISILENMNLNKTALKKISNYSRGDLRKAINFLQRCKNSFDDKINDELIDEMSGFINKNYLTQFINTCLEKNEILVLEMINYIYTNSFSFINQLVIINDIINEIDIDDDKKCKIFMELVNIDQNLLKSSNELIQLYHFSYFLMTL
jgi:replication factor C subunit 2/4